MTPDEHLAALRADGARLHAVPADALALAVPSCPDWTVAELIGHTGRVHRWATAMLDVAPDASRDEVRARRRALPDPPEGPAVLGYYRDGLDALVAALGAADPDAPVWTFAGPDTNRFWFRRQAQELSVHRWDAEDALAAGAMGAAPAPIDGDLAADGIDEHLRVFLPRFLPTDPDGVPHTLHLHGTDDPLPDEPAEWLVRLDGAGGVDVTAEHAKGDVALRGRVEDLLLVLWRRRPLSTLDVVGDASVAERVLEGTRVT